MVRYAFNDLFLLLLIVPISISSAPVSSTRRPFPTHVCSEQETWTSKPVARFPRPSPFGEQLPRALSPAPARPAVPHSPLHPGAARTGRQAQAKRQTAPKDRWRVAAPATGPGRSWGRGRGLPGGARPGPAVSVAMTGGLLAPLSPPAGADTLSGRGRGSAPLPGPEDPAAPGASPWGGGGSGKTHPSSDARRRRPLPAAPLATLREKRSPRRIG